MLKAATNTIKMETFIEKNQKKNAKKKLLLYHKRFTAVVVYTKCERAACRAAYGMLEKLHPYVHKTATFYE